jgi:hypothetical protein
MTLVFGAVAVGAEKTEKDIIVEDATNISNDNPDFKIAIRPSSRTGRFCIGDEIEFKFKTNQDAYLTIIDIGTSGKVHVIFPNKWHKSNKVYKDREYRIPGSDSDFLYRVVGPRGVNYIKAIGTLKPFDCFHRDALIYGEGPFAEVKDAKLRVKDLAVELKKKPQKQWTEAETNFTIERCGDRSEESAEDSEDLVAKLWTERKVYRIGERVSFFFFSDRD